MKKSGSRGSLNGQKYSTISRLSGASGTGPRTISGQSDRGKQKENDCNKQIKRVNINL